MFLLPSVFVDRDFSSFMAFFLFFGSEPVVFKQIIDSYLYSQNFHIIINIITIIIIIIIIPSEFFIPALVGWLSLESEGQQIS